MSRGLFITATGTDVGKTYVTALILKKLREAGLHAGYYKAALSGAERVGGRLIPGDAKHVCDVAGISDDPSSLVSYVYETAVSPHLAASLEGNPIELDVVMSDYKQAQKRFDFLCVEGSGGIVCPLRFDEAQSIMLADVIKALHLDVLIVASAALGTINSTVLTVEYARTMDIGIRGIILNCYDESELLHRDNKMQIERMTGVTVVACIKPKADDLDMEAQDLIKLFGEGLR